MVNFVEWQLAPGMAPQEADNVTLGRAVRHLWSLSEDTIPLNHGSFGACPRSVQEVQRALKETLESEPDRFFDDFIVPLSCRTPLRTVLQRAADFVGASPDGLAFVENATIGIDAVLRSMSFCAADRILITNQTYGAVTLAVEDRCRETGALLDIVSLSTTADTEEILAEFDAGIRRETRLVIVDHIASISSQILPVQEIVDLCADRGVRVLVDGAHAAGQVPLSLASLGADWYVTNLHKWAYAPRGTCLLYAGPEVRRSTRPTIISHHVGLGFPQSFDYVGTRDYTGWLASDAALSFHQYVGFERATDHARTVLDYATDRLLKIGASPLRPQAQGAWMRSYRLPRTSPLDNNIAGRFRHLLWSRHRIQAFVHTLEGEMILRVSAPPYVDHEDINVLVDVLDGDGWPGRR